MSADALAGAILGLASSRPVSLLDACGVWPDGSRYMIAGIVGRPGEAANDAKEALRELDRLNTSSFPSIFRISYELGMELLNIPRTDKHSQAAEPFLSYRTFDVLIVHDYASGRSYLAGRTELFDEVETVLRSSQFVPSQRRYTIRTTADRSESDHIEAVEEIKELIRAGVTYQANLTRSVAVEFDREPDAAQIFARLRRDHPAPFAAFISGGGSSVVSASPERFLKIADGRIVVSPIKGTFPRGTSADEDERNRQQLLASAKDRSENVMITDLMRNDLGRVCEFGSVVVDRLCEVQTLPSLFHLVSTVSGILKKGTPLSEVIRALFPCGSITGAPKISTMKIIEQIERGPRGLSMGAIGCTIPKGFGIPFSTQMSVAIRTMSIKGRTGCFNVGGGIVIDSDPAAEYRETVLKSKALLAAIGAEES